MGNDWILRKATLADASSIKNLLEENVATLLPRSEQEIKSLIDCFWVIEEGGLLVGCSCLEVYSPKIAEVRSVAVCAKCRGKGYGEELVRAALNEAKNRGIREVLAITSAVPFFEKLNFGPCLNERYALF